MPICDRCGNESPSGFRFCGACGAPLPQPVVRPDARKVVTALFCDIAGSTELGAELDPEALHSVLTRYFEAISATIERHGGTVQKFAGDAVLAVFGIPRVHEDDALRAVRAADEINERVPLVAEEIGVPLRFRTGLNTGLVLTDEGRTLAMGDAVNVAARLEQAAQPGEILLGSETLRLVRDAVEVETLEPLTLKGKSEPVPAFRLLCVDPVAPGHARRPDVTLVDREDELRLLREAWERTLGEPGCHLFTLLGAAGVGKSRLVDQLLAEVGRAATTLRGRCLHYGEGITFWPIVEALTPLGAGSQSVRDRLSGGGAATPGELFWEVRRHLESLADERPVILHVDDLHWAEPMLVELLDHIVSLSLGAPILVLCAARPELLEGHPEWSAGKPNATTVLLEALSSADCEQLLQRLGDELSRQARARVIETSEGNPLFLQEMVVLAREGGELDVPPTIQALLAERLERLPRDERELLERGAIEGQVFHRSAVSVLGGLGSPVEVESQLAGLVRKDLIRPHPSNVPGDEAFRFRHLLIRDAAYERLPKARRADLHERYARWLERTPVDFLEVDEIAGWHLEQAVRHERELRREVDPGLTRGAAEHLCAAGQRAGARSDLVAARNLLERALALAPEGDQLSTRIGVELAEQLIEAGDLARADELLSAAEHDQKALGPASLNRLEWLVYAQPGEANQRIESSLPRMLDELSRCEDDRGLAKAHMLAFWMQWTSSRATLAGEEVRLAARHARKAGDIGLWSRALGWYVATLIYGPQSARAIAAELDAIEEEQPGPYLAAFVDLGRGEVERLDRRFGDARRLTERALEGFRALGMHTMAATCEQSLAWIELSKGDAASALESLLRADAILAESGERSLRSTTQAMVARAHAILGAPDSSQTALELAEHLSAPQEALNYATTHEVRARLALASGDFEAAERWARSAVSHALETDFVVLQARTKLELARVLSAHGRTEEGRSEARAALGLCDAKGDGPGSDAALALLDTLE
jgi:class 3 adenylate cyclase/tetratricopeptide (TPR) repeat protein